MDLFIGASNFLTHRNMIFFLLLIIFLLLAFDYSALKRISNNVMVVLSLSITKLVHLYFLLVYPFLFLTSLLATFHFYILFLQIPL